MAAARPVAPSPDESIGRTEQADEDHLQSSFVSIVFRKKGCWIILLVAFLLSLGTGSVIGLVPDAAADRFSRLNHSYNEAFHCSSFDPDRTPDSCRKGSDDAQLAATVSNGVMNLVSFTLNPIMGSYSDVRGRKPMILVSLVVSTLPAIALVIMLSYPNVSPAIYYTANASGGSTYFLGIAFATFSDLIPDPRLRASSYGLLLASVYAGYALGPSAFLLFPTATTSTATPTPIQSFFSLPSSASSSPSSSSSLIDIQVAWFSLSLMIVSLGIASLCLPESLPLHLRQEKKERLRHLLSTSGSALGAGRGYAHIILRPLQNLEILNRSVQLQLLAVASFFSSMVYASDVTLVVYYMKSDLHVQAVDLARMFLGMGLAGILLQGNLHFLVQRCSGRILFVSKKKDPENGEAHGRSRDAEWQLLVLTFACGIVHNSLYAIATRSHLEYLVAALILAQFTKLNFPLLSSLASQSVSAHEQGQIQGALFATNAIASAVGPLSMEYVYRRTASISTSANRFLGLGPGTMFVYAALLQAAGTLVAAFISSASPTTTTSPSDDTPLPTTTLHSPVTCDGGFGNNGDAAPEHSQEEADSDCTFPLLFSSSCSSSSSESMLIMFDDSTCSRNSPVVNDLEEPLLSIHPSEVQY